MDDAPRQSNDDHNPPGMGMLGLKLFLISLSMLFTASLVAYLLIRTTAKQKGLALGALHLPFSLWFSTAAMVAGSLTIRSAVRAAGEGRKPSLSKAMLATTILALVFLAIQAPSLYWVLQAHEQYRAHNIHLYGLILVLIALHAVHVMGGLIPLVITTARAMQSRYSASHHEAVRYCALYWHFLDVVWVVMFGVLLVIG